MKNISINDKVCITAVNASFSHSSLAAICLEKSCKNEVSVLPHTINEKTEYIAIDALRSGARIFAFPCYIWNIEKVLKIAKIIKCAVTDSVIIFGGPEVSYDSEKVLSENQFVDFVICGEGEEAFSRLVSGEKCEDIKGVSYRKDGVIFSSAPVCVKNLDSLPRLYTKESLSSLSGKMVYYETSRGCPFSCSYCLSSTSHGVRYYGIDRVFEDLMLFIENKVPLVKFVDRTFNCNAERSEKIIEFIIKNNISTRFHFEISADILSDRIIKLLKSAPKGTFQLEIGVQSTNPKTLEAINRKADISRISDVVRRLSENKNIHIHLDLIAGLPYEGYERFKESFNCVIALLPDMLQLGFLKLLKGCGIRKNADKYSYVFSDDPPYEVIKNEFIDAKELLKLKKCEAALDMFYNSGAFSDTVKSVLESTDNAYEFFERAGEYLAENGALFSPLPRKAQYEALFEILDRNEDFREKIKLDFIRNEKHTALLPCLNDGEDKEFYELAYSKAKEIFPDENLKSIKSHVRAFIYCKKRMLYDYDTKKLFELR